MAADIEDLNTDCSCITLDKEKLHRVLAAVMGDEKFCNDLGSSHANLVSERPVFLNAEHAAQMLAIVQAVEQVAQTRPYRLAVEAHTPGIAAFMPGPIGVFMGYDFHLGPDGPRLIEVNTNAGGALVNAYVREAQRVCCGEAGLEGGRSTGLAGELDRFVGTFRSEWARQRSAGELRSIAIVDHAPESQYLYPEFRLFQRLFEQHGIRVGITAPDALSHHENALWLNGQRIDLVYNRLTDFDLSGPACRILRAAYLAGDVVVTPNPWAHAHLADKRNLAILSDEALLRSWSVPEDTIATLRAGVPRTVIVDRVHSETLWRERAGLFFKPCAGFGSKAAYRGDKITKKVWEEILGASYVAQQIVPPSIRAVVIDGRAQQLKTDLRCYTYAGQILLVAARLYQGQTTNFRTPGGGFAPVFVGTGSASCAC